LNKPKTSGKENQVKRKMHKLVLSLVVIAGVVVFAAGIGQATPLSSFNGTIWENDNSDNAGVVPSNSNPYATFTYSAIDFNSNITGYTPAQFLDNPTFTGYNNFNPNASLDNTHVQLTGTIYLNAGANTITVTHDDGVVMSIAGNNVLNLPLPTSEEASSFTITEANAGWYSFQIDYNECMGAPGILELSGANINGVPEPATLLLLGAGLVGLAASRRRAKRA
jgi:hypothetical protein